MKRIIVSFCLVISLVMSVGLFAQNNDTNVDKKIEKEWTNSIAPFVGVWSLERTINDVDGMEKKVYPGTFMVVHPNASYTIFVGTDVGAVITSQGTIMIQSSDTYVEVISHHVNSSQIGISNRIDYTLGYTYLHKSFWVEKDKHGDDYKRQVTETWMRAKMPVEGEYDNNGAFPI